MKPTVICLTPIKNEAWILDKFLKSTSLWADIIIISDQMSTDGSREIAKSYSKVILVDNDQKTDFSEYNMRKPLIDAARKIPGDKLLIALDADEIFTPNFSSKEWEEMKKLPKGAVIKFPWINVYKNFENYWDYNYSIPVGYVDDNVEFVSGLIHASRLFDPNKNTKVVYEASEVKILHLQYTDWERMKMKHRWYQCFERISFPEKKPLDIYRQYHHMDSLQKQDFQDVPACWIDQYNSLGVDVKSTSDLKNYHWEEKILNYFDEKGTRFFRKMAIWDINWIEKAENYGRENPSKYKDPRTVVDVLVQNILFHTQNKQNKKFYRRLDRVLKSFY